MYDEWKIRRDRECAQFAEDNRLAARRAALLIGMCPDCGDDLPLSGGAHACPEQATK
jgi:hypothetical protein